MGRYSMEMKQRLTMHLSYAQIPRRPVNLMDIKEVFRFVAPQVREAAIKTAEQLHLLGIRYALAGGLAVGAHGYIGATIDVDFLVGEEAFEHRGSLVAFKAGVPIEVDGVRIDYLSPAALGPQLEEVLDHPPMRSEEHTSELQSRFDLVCRLLLEKKNMAGHFVLTGHVD